jgi:hypothetical protein
MMKALGEEDGVAAIKESKKKSTGRKQARK